MKLTKKQKAFSEKMRKAPKLACGCHKNMKYLCTDHAMFGLTIFDKGYQTARKEQPVHKQVLTRIDEIEAVSEGESIGAEEVETEAEVEAEAEEIDEIPEDSVETAEE